MAFVFETDQALAKFLDSGWAGETQADAAAETSKVGAAYSEAAMIAKSVGVPDHQEGSSTPVNPAGTKYTKNDELNKK